MAYSLERARWLAAASAEAYKADHRGHAVQWADTGTRTLILAEETDVIVAFRGTAHARDWLTDLDCRLVKFSSFRVHHGFLAALQPMLHEIEQVLAEFPGARVWATGHSLGGALAMLFARLSRSALAGVYTFGQPRVGDAAFRRNYDFFLGNVTFRIVHADDIVPRVPWLLGSFRHAGQEVFYPEPPSNNWELNPAWPRKLPSDLRGLVREARRGRDALLDDHHIDNYLRLLGADEQTLARQAT